MEQQLEKIIDTFLEHISPTLYTFSLLFSILLAAAGISLLIIRKSHRYQKLCGILCIVLSLAAAVCWFLQQ